MRISLLCPTLGERDFELTRLVTSLNEQVYTDFELIVVSQENHDRVSERLRAAQFTVWHLRSSTRGISTARNLGMPRVTGDILLLSDDDCWYHPSSLALVCDHFAKNEGRPVLCFKHVDLSNGTHYRKYPHRSRSNLTYRELLSVASIDICFDMRLCGRFITFDESFGVGARFGSGEECILLTELKKMGFSIGYIPELLSYHPTKQAQGALGRRELRTKAAIFRRLYGSKPGLLVFLMYLVKKLLLLVPFYLTQEQ